MAWEPVSKNSCRAAALGGRVDLTHFEMEAVYCLVALEQNSMDVFPSMDLDKAHACVSYDCLGSGGHFEATASMSAVWYEHSGCRARFSYMPWHS